MFRTLGLVLATSLCLFLSISPATAKIKDNPFIHKGLPVVAASKFHGFLGIELNLWTASQSKLAAAAAAFLPKFSPREGLVVTLALVIAILCALAAYSLHEQAQLRSARARLMKLSGMLIDSQERERARLASELHDDFSQRMALLSVGLETLDEVIPSNPQEACQQLRQLIDSACDIGIDLHTISHRLHSATLKRLGLVPGVNSFCREFSAQQGIRVTFAHENVPKDISPDVALCLFRIVQEALRNVKKHSLATEARVTLTSANRALHLSIQDRGVGFQTKAQHDKGLGLLSIEERCRLQGGDFRLTSEPGKGTIVNVRLPIRAPEMSLHV
jgi:signal transduction histidine kinase